jgi:hypothetical protein
MDDKKHASPFAVSITHVLGPWSGRSPPFPFNSALDHPSSPRPEHRPASEIPRGGHGVQGFAPFGRRLQRPWTPRPRRGQRSGVARRSRSTWSMPHRRLQHGRHRPGPAVPGNDGRHRHPLLSNRGSTRLWRNSDSTVSSTKTTRSILPPRVRENRSVARERAAVR